MRNPWALSALWVGLAAVATLLAIWFKAQFILETEHSDGANTRLSKEDRFWRNI